MKPALCLLVIAPCLALQTKPSYNKCPASYKLGIKVKCSTDFQKYCAIYSEDGETRQKLTANECTACTDSKVRGYLTHACTDQRVYCDSRVRPDFCTKEYTSLCAYTSENCNDDSCRKRGGNPCMACRDPEVLFYEKGECPQPPQGPTTGTCDAANRPTECVTDEYAPVCASYTEGCPFDTCATTFNAPCLACLESKVSTYEEGECDPSQEIYSCDVFDLPPVCSANYQPVCASKRDCTGEGCTMTFSNGCSACSSGYAIFKNGECPQN